MRAPTLQEYRERPAHPARREGGLRARGAFARSSQPGTPLLSIVTVVYNGQATLERTLRSVLGQTYPNIEHIIIDGGSTDGTLEIVQRYDDQLAYWLSEPDAGIFDAMNKGVALAGGAYIAILNADDYYAPQAAERVVSAVNKEHSDVVFTDYVFVADDIHMEGPVTATLRLTRGMTLSHPGMFVSKETYEKHGLYALDYTYASDLDFALRLFLARLRFTKVAEPLAYFVSGGTAERHLCRASVEAIAIIKEQAGLLSALPYMLMFAKRVCLRGTNWCVRTLLGRRACLWVKRGYYGGLKGFKEQTAQQ
ncbi:MAG: glycosyltransferase family 2 protein [Planctomycetota bacterium]|nr:glycosyltransferase family 2 protein [Planctomycetota bacterium]